MRWVDVLNDPSLKDLPYKIELNRWGNIEMSPASNKHGFLQSRLSAWLAKALPQGESICECSIQTDDGVKVPDVAWCSAEFLRTHGFSTPFPGAPDLCIEILSPSNSRGQMLEKINIYLATGAKEAWLVSDGGGVEAFGQQGMVSASSLGVDLAALANALKSFP